MLNTANNAEEFKLKLCDYQAALKTQKDSNIMPNSDVFLHTHHISDIVALRIYSDTKPLNMKIANLQKGLILLQNGIEVIGEGAGFGVPILKCANETFFSGTAYLEVHKRASQLIIRKTFFMDYLLRDKFRNVKLENIELRRKIDFISSLYQNHKHFAQLTLFIKRFVSMFGVESIFSKTTSRGKVIVTYTLDKNKILVNLNFNQLDQNNLQKVFVLNEQGAHFFSEYSDSRAQIN